MNQQKEESKLEQAAKDYVMKSRLSSSSIDRLKDIARHTSFIAGAKSEAAKEYWQSLTTPAGKELDCEVFILIDGMIARIPKEHEDIFDVTFGSSYMLQVAKENGSYKVVNAVDGRGTNCFIHFKDKEVKVLFTNATPSKPNTVEEAGQTQEPVGGMKWEDVQILAKKHAEHIIEMGWRDNPDKDDIIADFISGYASAPPPAPIKTEGEDETQHQYENGEWSRSYTPQQEFPQSPSDILKKYSDSRFNVSMPFNWDILYRAMEDYANQFKTDPAPPSPVGIDVEELADEYLKKVGTHDRPDITKHDFIEGLKAGYAARLGESKASIEELKKEYSKWFFAQSPYWPTPDQCFDWFIKNATSLPQSSTSERINQLESGIKQFLLWLKEKRPSMAGHGAPIMILEDLLNNKTNDLIKQSTSEEEKDLWEEALDIASRHEFLMTKYKDTVEDLQSKFKISKR